MATAHVHPLGDLVEHLLSEECICGPKITYSVDERNRTNKLVIHNSLDGREIGDWSERMQRFDGVEKPLGWYATVVS